MKNNGVALFEEKEIRKIWFDNNGGSVIDVVMVLTDSVNLETIGIK